ncbi:hypothetical protein LTR37_015501 [Vermiconidia calcicola]|uniref:Uncharacterized protein n=1 Tax=Vermiconidia calcicola TaxID=1690605 RepID=A0ACC3MQI0_9PEZI|nr:hypothetical protein LTR37_015501 [Vermiconidia calcicola]
MQLKSIILLLSTAVVVPAQEAFCVTPTWLLEVAHSKDVACDISKIATAKYKQLDRELHGIYAMYQLFYDKGAVKAPAYAKAEAIGEQCYRAVSEFHDSIHVLTGAHIQVDGALLEFRNLEKEYCQAKVTPNNAGLPVKQSRKISKAFGEFMQAEQAYDKTKLAQSAAAETAKKICTEAEMSPLQDLMAWREQQKTGMKSSTASQVGQRAASALADPASTQNLTAAATLAFADWLPGWWV